MTGNDRTDHERGDAFAKRRADYQAVQAPRWVATRIKAAARDHERQSGNPWGRVWRPATAGLALVLGLLAVGPLMEGNGVNQTTTPPLPSLTALSRNLPAKPPSSVPSLGQLRSLRTPAMPARPQSSDPEPQSQNRKFYTNDLFAYAKEKHDENA